MRTYHYRYLVRLSEEQRRWLETIIHTSRTPVRHYVVARVLLMSEASVKANQRQPMGRRLRSSPSVAAR